jgi:transposase
MEEKQMARTYTPEENIVEHAFYLCRESETSTELRRSLSVLLGAEARLDSETIARMLQIDKRTVYRLRNDVAAEATGTKIDSTLGWGGQRISLMSEADELAFLDNFKEAAIAGELVSLNVIHAALVEAIGRNFSISTTNKLLKRHGWRKVKPDKRHPKSDPAAQEEFKKNSQACWMPPLKKM